MKLLRQMLALSTIVLLSACSMTVRNDVTSFHHLPAPNGEAVAIVPMSLSQDPDGLEFQEYAMLVRKQLTMLGYARASREDADLIVELGYGVKRDRSRQRDPFRDPFGMYYPWGGFGYGYYNWYHWRHNSFFYHNYYDPFYGPWGPGYRNRSMHIRSLMLDIRKAGGEKVYEGRVESLGNSKNLPAVLPYMIEAMFTGFPGESGTVKQVVIREEKEK